jgi:hypothetical protein
MGVTCEHCSWPTSYAESVPDAATPGTSPGECGYRMAALCWLHAAERRQVATARLYDALVCPSEHLARVDRGRAGGDCACEVCGRTYFRHPESRDYPFLTVLCDGSLVKL